MAGSTIGNSPSGENTSPDGTEKIPLSGSKFIQIANIIARKLRETSGPTTLSMGAITDGQYLKRSGTSIISGSVDISSASTENLINGKISVTVASNNITVAIKTLADATPSASDTVYVRVGNTVRSITSALSVTKNAGTNWCNSGGAELATKEVDYFVYIGYNATDGVVIGFSRIPYGKVYSEFSTTSTDELYCAISTITNASSADTYVNVGRFAATLSAGAGYTWTVPTYTSANLIQRQILTSRWLSWAPTYTGFSSNPTGTETYKVLDDIIYIHRDVSTNGTSNATTFTMTFPFKFAVASAIYSWVATTDNGATGSTPGHLQATSAASNVGSLFKTFYQGAWTNTGAKNVYLLDFNYRIR